ncbi:MAG: hypothetical protein FJZ63_02885 [Chlamydiae bacterium]|nr:hypothetical protein [Chlamydiota bacterium]
MRYSLFLFLFLVHAAIYGKSVHTRAQEKTLIDAENTFKPWFTGPLLAGSAHTVPAGHVLWEPYLFAIDSFGFYDDHWKPRSAPHSLSLEPFLLFIHGLNSFMDLQVTPYLLSNFQQGSHDTRMGDLPFALGFQVLTDKPNSWIPDLRLLLREIFPTGHYQHLNPHKHGTDATGNGSFQTGLGLNFQKLFITGIRLLRLRLNFNYLFPSPVRVKSFNTYGGGYGTHGKVYPGQKFSTIFAVEYLFSQHLVAALDIQYLFSSKDRFSGYPGITSAGQNAIVGNLASHQLNLAPAIEYNFNENLGIIFGPWFSVAGKNSDRFVSAVFAINYYH